MTPTGQTSSSTPEDHGDCVVRSHRRPHRSSLAIATGPFLLGLNTQIAQLLILREALILSSGSETSLSLALGAWALLNGAGALVGGLARRWGAPVGRAFDALLLLLPILLALSLHGARISRGLTDVPGAEHLPISTFLFLILLFVGPVTFIDGLLFVGGLQRFFGPRGAGSGGSDTGRGSRGSSGRGAASMYGLESAGSLAGGVVFSFVLVSLFDPFAVVGLLVLANVIALHRVAADHRGWRWVVPRGSLALLGLLLVGLGPWINGLSEEARWERLQPGMELITSRETPYQNLAILRHRDESTLFGNGGVITSLRPRSTESYGEWDRAVFPHFAMLQHRAPRTILLVGGGLQGYLTDLLVHEPDRIDWVEYDGAMIEMTCEFLVDEERASLEDLRVAHHVDDGRHFVAGAPPETYDLILLDLPDPSNAAANRYYTREFFRSCRRCLAEGGVVVFNLSCQSSFIGPEMMRRNGSIFGALGEVFPNVLITPGEISYLAAAASSVSLSASAEELMKRYESRGIESERFSPYVFYTWFQEHDVTWINGLFQEKRNDPALVLNTDNRPTAYFEDYLLWRRITGVAEEDTGICGVLDRWLAGTGEREPPLLWLPLALPLAGLLLFCLALGLPSSAPERFAARSLLLTTAVAAGFCGILLEVAVLLAYQAVAGHLYSRMGILIAAYMAGLAFGALLPRQRASSRILFLFSCVATFLGVGATIALLSQLGASGTSGEALGAFVVATMVLGCAGGLVFRGVAVALERDGRAPGGTIYALDILGTCVGALLAGSVLIPLIGIVGALLLAGGINVLLPLLCIAVRSRPNRGKAQHAA